MNDFPIEKIYVRYKNGTKLEYSLTTPLHQLRLIVPPPPPLVWGGYGKYSQMNIQLVVYTG